MYVLLSSGSCSFIMCNIKPLYLVLVLAKTQYFCPYYDDSFDLLASESSLHPSAISIERTNQDPRSTQQSPVM